MRSPLVRIVAVPVAMLGAAHVLAALRIFPLRVSASLYPSLSPGRAQMYLLGGLLLLLARGLLRLRWAAYLGTLAALGTALLVTVSTHRPIATLLCGATLIGLVTVRHAFRTRPDPARLHLAAQLSVVSLGAAVAGGAWDVMARRHAPGGTGRSVMSDLSTGSPGGPVAIVLVLVLGVTLLAAVAAVLAPAVAPPPGSRYERDLVRELAAHPDADSLAPFATRRDKSYVFSPDGHAAIGYRVILGTALIGGDPVGAAASVPAAMTAYLDLCARRGWRPGVLGAGDAMRAAWRGHGLRGLHVGDEAVLPTATFGLSGRSMRNVRQAVGRTRNAGITVAIGPLTHHAAAELAPVVADWLHGTGERGFAMNLDALLVPRPDCLVAVARSASGEAVAFARFAVCAGGTCYTLDVAPRGRNAPNGAAERMIAEIVDYGRNHGATEVSLNFAAMRWMFDTPGLVPRAGAAAMHALDRWIEVGSLNRFCAKFHPSWRGRHLLTRSWLELGWVAAAAIRAEFTPTRTPLPESGADTERIHAADSDAPHFPARRP